MTTADARTGANKHTKGMTKSCRSMAIDGKTRCISMVIVPRATLRGALDMLASVRRKMSRRKCIVRGECNVPEWTIEKAAVRGINRQLCLVSTVIGVATP